MVTRAVKPSEGAVLALHMGHDASMAVSYRGRVQCVLELERLFGQRSLGGRKGDPAQFQASWNLAFEKVQTRCVFEDGWPLRFEHAVLVAPPVHETEQAMLIMAAEQFFSRPAHFSCTPGIEKWHLVDHHEAHALSAFHSSPFRSALIVSYDSAGNDGHFNVYVGSFDKLERIAQLDYSLGHAYNALASLLPEVTGRPIDEFFACDMNFSDELLASKELYFEKNPFATLSWAGKLMGYAAVAAPREDLRHSVRFFIEASNAWIGVGSYAQKYPPALVKAACESAESQRELAATIQSEFEAFVRQPLQYLGFPLWDEALVLRHARQRGAQRLSKLGGIEYLAELLAGGEVWRRQRNHTADKPIVAVVRGRQEFGPRALGHRSLLAVPDGDMKKRMNRLKARQWYRPVAPMIAEERVLGGGERRRPVFSRTMAPRVRPEIQKSFPSLVHLDGTARHQSVSQFDEAWIHALLLAVGRHTGLVARLKKKKEMKAALINTSFNTKGKPIVNTVKESLRRDSKTAGMLDELPDLDFLIVEDWLFRKRRFLEKRNVADAAASGTSK
ncbi:Nodulation protein NolO [Durusdinium trenchii]|uniref:Nodulation protein NolO n=1 Tax=Durusdinium trenchii TaxID=1381693 RepID=A0ABP0NMU6_9DINO